MMTTGKTFNTSTIQNAHGTVSEQRVLNEVAPPIVSNTPLESVSQSTDNLKILNEWIVKFTKGEITEAQLKTIKATLGFN